MRRRSWGILLSGMLLVFLVLEAVSVAVDQWFGRRADPSVPMLVFLWSIDAPDVRAARRR
jgi:hypothetical protein